MISDLTEDFKDEYSLVYKKDGDSYLILLNFGGGTHIFGGFAKDQNIY